MRSTVEQQTLEKFLGTQMFATPWAAANEAKVLPRLGSLLGANSMFLWHSVLLPFITKEPYRYWDTEAVRIAAAALDRDKDRTSAALRVWRREHAVAWDLLFVPSPAARDEGSISGITVDSVSRLATVYHPEYLRYCEHIYRNLLVLYWAVSRKGGIDASFNLRAAADAVRKRISPLLVCGYEERVRNAIAHGEIVYRGMNIAYGPERAKYELTSSEMLKHFDELVRTTNALAIGVILHLNHLEEDRWSELTLPPRIIALLASAALNERVGAVRGAYESETVRNEHQLHIGIRTPYLAREAILLQAAILSYQLLKWGASQYERFLFEIDNGRPVPGLVAVRAHTLQRLLDEQAPMQRLSEIFADTKLLWSHEPSVLRAWRSWRLAMSATRSTWQTRNPKRNNSSYTVKHVSHNSVRWLARIKAIVVLHDPAIADDRQALRGVIRSAMNRLGRKWTRTAFGPPDRPWGWPSLPGQVMASFYRGDGSRRWLQGSGWQGGMLVAQAERIHGPARMYKPVLVKDPEETLGGIRIRFTVDRKRAESALATLRGILDNEKRRTPSV